MEEDFAGGRRFCRWKKILFIVFLQTINKHCQYRVLFDKIGNISEKSNDDLEIKDKTHVSYRVSSQLY